MREIILTNKHLQLKSKILNNIHASTRCRITPPKLPLPLCSEEFVFEESALLVMNDLLNHLLELIASETSHLRNQYFYTGLINIRDIQTAISLFIPRITGRICIGEADRAADLFRNFETERLNPSLEIERNLIFPPQLIGKWFIEELSKCQSTMKLATNSYSSVYLAAVFSTISLMMLHEMGIRHGNVKELNLVKFIQQDVDLFEIFQGCPSIEKYNNRDIIKNYESQRKQLSYTDLPPSVEVTIFYFILLVFSLFYF